MTNLTPASARALLFVGIGILAAGLLFFALAPLVAILLMVAGALLTAIAGSHWATRSGRAGRQATAHRKH